MGRRMVEAPSPLRSQPAKRFVILGAAPLSLAPSLPFFLPPAKKSRSRHSVRQNMSRTKVNIVGVLRFSPEEGLTFSTTIRPQGGPVWTAWLEALPNTDNWPGLGPRPKPPERPQLDLGR